jgi:hypothetical protein
LLKDGCVTCALEFASLVWSRFTWNEHSPGSPSTDDVERLILESLEVGTREAAALLTMLGHLAGEGPIATRLFEAAKLLHHPLPLWLARMGEASVSTITEWAHDPYGSSHLQAEVRLGDGTKFTLLVSIHAHDWIHPREPELHSATAIPDRHSNVLRSFQSPRSNYRDADPADVRARLERVMHRFIPYTDHRSDTWPRNHPLLAWVARLLPEGEYGYDLPAWSDRWSFRSPGLSDLVGGIDGLRGLPSVVVPPLPDEVLEFDLSTLPADQQGAVRQIADEVDKASVALFGVEHRTACRRLLAAVLRTDPQVLTARRSKPVNTAATIVWIIANANGELLRSGGTLRVGDLAAQFGLSGTPSQRGFTLLRSLGLSWAMRDGALVLGDTKYLVARRRRLISQERDRLLARQSIRWDRPFEPSDE